jgi:hypothetical protein
MGLLGRLPTVFFYSRSLLSGHLNVHSVLEGRHLLILVDRVDIGWRKSSSPLGGHKYCGAVETAKWFCFYHRNLRLEARPPLGT